MKEYLQRLKWALKLLRTRTYVVLTDKSSVICIPMVALDELDREFEKHFVLAGQTAALKNFNERLEDLITEHDNELKLLAHREKQGK